MFCFVHAYILCSNCTDMKSTMAQLMRLKTIKGRKVEIINTISADWKEFAFLMDFIQRPRQRLQRLKQRMHKLREMVYSSAVRKCLCRGVRHGASRRTRFRKGRVKYRVKAAYVIVNFVMNSAGPTRTHDSVSISALRCTVPHPV